MKFTQICAGSWKNGPMGYYTLFALGEDGRVYKSVGGMRAPNHTGWIPLRDAILAEDYLGQVPKNRNAGIAAGGGLVSDVNAAQPEGPAV